MSPPPKPPPAPAPTLLHAPLPHVPLHAAKLATNIVMALCGDGLHSYGLYSHGIYTYDLHIHGLYSHGLYSYGLYRHAPLPHMPLHAEAHAVQNVHTGLRCCAAVLGCPHCLQLSRDAGQKITTDHAMMARNATGVQEKSGKSNGSRTETLCIVIDMIRGEAGPGGAGGDHKDAPGTLIDQSLVPISYIVLFFSSWG